MTYKAYGLKLLCINNFRAKNKKKPTILKFRFSSALLHNSYFYQTRLLLKLVKQNL